MEPLHLVNAYTFEMLQRFFAFDTFGYDPHSDGMGNADNGIDKCGAFRVFEHTAHEGMRTGSYIYHGDPEGRAWFRQTKVHQTLTLNGENSKYAPKLLKWEPGTDLDLLVIENASYDQLSHRRYVFFVDKRYFIIVDEAIGTAIGDVDVHFQLAAGTAAFDKNDFSVHSGFTEGWNVFVQSNKQKGLEFNEEEGRVSLEYTKYEDRPAFRYRLKKTDESQSIQFVTVVAPYKEEIPDIKCEIINSSQTGANKLQVLIKENGIERILNCEW